MESVSSFSRAVTAALLLAAAVMAAGAESPAGAPEEIPVGSLRWHLPSCAKIEGGVLSVEVGPDTEGDTRAWAEIDLSDCRDGFTAEISASGEKVSKPSAPWLGFKFMVRYRDPLLAADSYPGAPGVTGTFSNRIFRIDDTFPGRSREGARLYLGLEDSTGKVSFDLSTLRIRRSGPAFAMTNRNWVVGYPESVSRRPARRGFMSPHDPTEKDFADMAAMGATLVRYQMCRTTYGWDEARLLDLAAYREWLEGRLDLLDKMLAWAGKYGIDVAVDLHHTPGGKDPRRGLRIFHREECLAEFVETWRKIATRFKGRKNIYGYDLVNEPTHGSDRLVDYWEAQRLAAEAVREIDPDATIIVESNGMDAPETFAYLSPLAMDNVIYEVHVYIPGGYTHQGVFAAGRGAAPLAWPDRVKGWNRGFLARALRSVRDFQKRHGARIYVGEFSAAAWAPGAERYLADCISLFEEYGWDWTYHAFREASCWSLEMDGPDRDNLSPSTDNARMRAVRDGLKHVAIELVAPIDGATVALISEAQKAAMSPETLGERMALLRGDGARGSVFGKDAVWRRALPLVLEWRAGEGVTAPWKVEVGASPDFSDARVWFVGEKDENLTAAKDHGVEDARDKAVVMSFRVPCANLEVGRTYHWRVSGTKHAASGRKNGRPVQSAAAAFATEDRTPRWIALEGRVGNVRDIGGWRTADGRRVRQGMAFRGQGLNDNSVTGERQGRNRLTVEDVRYLTGTLGIRTDLDLRRPDETADLEQSPMGPGVKLVKRASPCYRGIFSAEGKATMAENIRIFCNPRNYPIYFHCIGGADRTGSLAYILLGALGVPRHDIETDWESTFYPKIPDMRNDPGFWQRESHFSEGFSKYGEEDDTWRRRIELYLLDCGLAEEELALLRDILLE